MVSSGVELVCADTLYVVIIIVNVNICHFIIVHITGRPSSRADAIIIMMRSLYHSWVSKATISDFLLAYKHTSLHYGKVSMGGGAFKISNFVSRLEENITFAFNFFSFASNSPCNNFENEQNS